jgi:hypothetical protein
MMEISHEEMEKLILYRFSHVRKRHKDKTKGIFSFDNSILEVDGCIKKKGYYLY